MRAPSAFIGTLLPVHASHVLLLSLGAGFGCAPPSPAAAGPGAATDRTEQPAQMNDDDAKAQPPSPPMLGASEGSTTPPERAPAESSPQASSPQAQPHGAEHHLRLQRVRSYNRHRQGGADNEQLEATLALDLAADGTAQLADAGEHRSSHLNGDSHSGITRRWKAVWSGRWRPESGALLLELSRASYTCGGDERLRIGLHSETKPHTCEPTAEKVELRCQPTIVDRDGPLAAWSCSAEDEMGGAPRPWVFAREGCLRLSDGIGRRTYRECADSAQR